MKKRVIKFVIRAGPVLLSLLPLWAGNTQAASFDCNKARTNVEKMICSDPEMSKLDEEMDKVYQTALKNQQQTDAIREDQKKWLRGRNKCGNVACLQQEYNTRLASLQESAHSPVLSGKNTDPIPTKKEGRKEKEPLYGHCVDLQDPHNCGEQSGKGYAVCETYLKYLNTLDKYPLCELPMPPGFTRPDWQELDVMQHLDWAYQAEYMTYDTDWFKKENPDEATWRQKFLAEVQAGAIVPAMRTVKIKPFAEGEEITILAYTRNRRGCMDIVNGKNGDWWGGIGYAHFRIMDTPDKHLAEIGGTYGIVGQTEMLFYAGKPYFVKNYGSGIPGVSDIGIIAFDPGLLPEPFEQKYTVRDQCMFDAVEPYKRRKK